jgi:hypothetical protein
MRLQLGENARMALDTLREHKMRSFLTVLGVVIGITALISVASILVGLDRDIRAYLDDYGTDTLFVFKWSPGFRTGQLTTEERTRKPLTLEDALAHPGILPGCQKRHRGGFPAHRNGPAAAAQRSVPRPSGFRHRIHWGAAQL